MPSPLPRTSWRDHSARNSRLTSRSASTSARNDGSPLGRRRVFQAGLALFGASSALCGAATSGGLLVGARVLQGVGAAAMLPQVLSVIQVEFAPHERGRALSIMGAVQGVACVGGQLAGGALIELDVLGLGWRAVFLVNVPLAVAAIVLAGRLVPDSRGRRRGSSTSAVSRSAWWRSRRSPCRSSRPAARAGRGGRSPRSRPRSRSLPRSSRGSGASRLAAARRSSRWACSRCARSASG